MARLRVLASVYACGPKWGSEIGMGWNWISHLARYCEVTVLTERGFQDDIAAAASVFCGAAEPRFYYIDVEDKGRRQFWKQGDWRFYWHYRKWQQRAFVVAGELTKKMGFDVAHQLNMIGYREPGYLWKLPLPFVWGPIGGHAQMPWRFMRILGLRAALKYTARNLLNAVQMRTHARVRVATTRAAALIAATEADQKAIWSVHRRRAVLINETGTRPLEARTGRSTYNADRPFRLAWCGFFVGRKGMPLALRAIASVPAERPVELHIIGYGPEEARWRALARDLGIDARCRWLGRLDHKDALDAMAECDCLLFTSLQEGTSHAVLEALGMGLPVICHDCCGHGDSIDEGCGIKIPVVSPASSIKGFTAAIAMLAGSPSLMTQMSRAAVGRAEALSWDNKARQMVEIYRRILHSGCSRTWPDDSTSSMRKHEKSE
ncbi:MAG TPA: glycosyltransferase family 4 protein [Phycisphaerae bacterium]|nr:glycosyltransferase family 4 protein [Phycisphaerae bacterium]